MARKKDDDLAREVPEITVSRTTLEGTPVRALMFLRGVGTAPGIYASMSQRGYMPADQDEGWKFLHECSGFTEGGLRGEMEVVPRARDAIAELDALDETLFRIVSATLNRRYPRVASRVLDGLSAATGPAAVLGEAALLDRLDALDTKADSEGRAALELLARRGYGPDERKRLRALVASAQSVPNLVNIDNEATERAERARVDALKRLRAWYEEWSEVARATVRRRDHLIRLGLATRRRGNAEEDEGAPEGDVLDATED